VLGNVILNRVTLRANYASARNLGDARGGAIFTNGTVTAAGGTYSGNHAYGGDANYVCDYIFIGGNMFPSVCRGPSTGGSAYGGVIYARGDIHAQQVVMTDNDALPGVAAPFVVWEEVPPYGRLPTLRFVRIGNAGAPVQSEGNVVIDGG
jgi:hypothetical protein